MIPSSDVRSRAVLVAAALLAGCGTFGETEAPPGDAGTASPDAIADAAAPPPPPIDAGSSGLPTPDDCALRGTTLDAQGFETMPPVGWTESDPEDLVTLDADPEDVVSAPTSLRAGVVARSSGAANGTIARTFPQALAGTLCITFQGRLFVGPEGFGATPANDFVGLFGADLAESAGAKVAVGVGVAIDQNGLRLHHQDATRDVVSPSVAFGDDVTYQRWTLVIAPSARRAAFWIGANHVEMPFELPTQMAVLTIKLGVAASGRVPEVTFHAEDLRVALLP